MRTVPLRALCCSVIALCLGSCAVAQEPIAVLPSFTDSTEGSKAATDPNLEPPVRPDFETDSDIEPAANVETALNVGRLEDIVRVALTANPAIAKARAKREALTGKRIQAGLGPNPQAGFFGEDIFEDGRGGRYGIFYGQEVVRGNKLALSQNVVDAEISTVCRQIEILEQRVKTDVQNRFYDVLLAQQRLNLTESLASMLAEIVKISEALIEAKEAAASSILQVEIEYERIKVIVAQTRLDLSAARQQLAAMINESELPFEQLEGDVTAVPSLPAIEEVYDALLTNSPEIAVELAKIETAERALQRATVESVPNVTWQTALKYDTTGEHVIADFQVGMPLPTVDWNQGNIRKARGEIVMASASVEQKLIQLRQRLIANYRDYAQAKLQVDAYANSILPKSKKSLELITASYRAGELNFLQVLTAQRTFFQAQLDYLNRLRTLRAKTILVEGQLLNASLQ